MPRYKRWHRPVGWADGPAPSGSADHQPSWWPEGESWPPQSRAGARDWSGFGRRLARLALVWLVLVVLLPLVVGVVLAVTVGGWTSVAVAVVSWGGLAVILGLALRSGAGFWPPVRSLIDLAGRLADGDYTARAEPTSRAPVRQVVESFNRLAERLERTETGRQRLLADVGHEIRTPLTIIRGELEAMADGVHPPDPPQLRRLLGDIDLMERLLDDLATLSRAEAGMLTIHHEPTDIVALIQEVVDGLQPTASAAGVTIALATAQVGLEAADEVVATIDPIRLKEIVSNLVTNGLRATPPSGRVDISVDRDDERLTIGVTDTGQGIPVADLDHVFERFHKGPNSTGSGLGLTISRDLARAHGGDITIVSEVDVGTTVTVSLPREP